MRLEQLDYLVALKKYGAMSIASEKLHVTQQTLSISIKTLEKELDGQLLIRTSKGVLLTTLGELVCEQAAKILFYRENIYQLALAEKNTNQKLPLKGQIKVAATQSTLQNFLGETMIRLNRRAPEVTIFSDGFLHSQVVPQLDCGNYDLGFMNISKDYFEANYDALFHDQYEIEVITSGKLSILASRRSKLITQKTHSLKSIIQKYTLPLPNEEILAFLNILPLLKTAGITPTILQCPNLNIVFDAVVDNDCVVLSSCNAWHLIRYYRKEEIIQLPLRDNIPVLTIAIIPKNRPLSAECQLFLEILRKIAQTTPANPDQ